MDVEERKMQLMQRSITELINYIIKLEDENREVKAYRKALNNIRNMVTPVDERRGRGRPRKED